MAHIRCLHCGGETEDDTKLSITHKSTCKSAGKDSDNACLDDKKASKPTSTPKAESTPTIETSPKKTTTSTKGGSKSRK